MKKQLDLQQFPAGNLPARILMGPGPSMVDPRVYQAMAAPLVGHLDPEFVHLMDRTQELLRYTFRTENKLTIPVSGTGSAAMEASIANSIEPGTPVLICINGYFGERLADMAKRYGGDVSTIHRPWGEVFTPSEIEQALREKPAKVVAIVHAETSTGAEQPLDEIAKIVHNHGAILIVDAVTSLGGVPLSVDEIGIDICYSGTQKCISAPPGLGPITFNERALNLIQSRKAPVISWYLDMSLVQSYWGPNRTYHHTAPITMNYALYEALRIIAEEGIENRWARHRANSEMFWEGLEDLNLKCFIPKEHRLTSLCTIQIPEGVDDAAVRKSLLEDYNIEISGGLGSLKGKIWRVGLMGYTSRKENILLLLAALKKILYK
ncbi:MAG TPA: alanine--glyoxylate aminotransferase family protein [Flexilinea sp.]|nr:alanine--glyoxylate aminotransferase family protein [Flexilinea sp.]HPS47677.1 alanine--glyoxylate aminotransferase family protein [Flexilinea sp.]